MVRRQHPRQGLEAQRVAFEGLVRLGTRGERQIDASLQELFKGVVTIC